MCLNRKLYVAKRKESMPVQYLAADSTVIIRIMLLLLIIQFQQKAYKNCPSRRERRQHLWMHGT